MFLSHDGQTQSEHASPTVPSQNMIGCQRNGDSDNTKSKKLFFSRRLHAAEYTNNWKRIPDMHSNTIVLH